MRFSFCLSLVVACTVAAWTGLAQDRLLDPEKLPSTINPAKKVHFVSVDGSFQPANSNWTACLKILTGADHVTEPIKIGGHDAVRVMGIKFNTADAQFPFWAGQHQIDILMQVFGDD